ncbi:MAG: PQQ-binding-like beta-propeller repeat protein [Trebonia sp.]|jgi:outer membrane protein assembly factor BamB
MAACTGGAIAASGAAGSTATASAAAAGAAGRTAAAYPAAAWPQFDQNADRTGLGAGLRAAGALSTAWTAHLDGAVYGQPLVVGGDVIAATENDTVYALSRATGRTVWRAHVGTPVPRSALHGCGDIFPLGITGTPIYDQADGLVYAVAETTGYQHTLLGLSVANGDVKARRDLDIASSADQPAWNQQRPALAIDGGRVYAAFGGLAGDCGAYLGSVVGVALNGKGPLVSWHTPTTREGAVWGTGGPVTGPKGTLWISNGNGAAGPGDPYDGSDSVTSLSPALHRLDYFAPASWAYDNAHDLDLGSTQPVRASGDSTFVIGKSGVGYLLYSSHFGGIGGERASLPVCKAFGAAADTGSIAYEPCSSGGMAAVYLDAAKAEIKVLWRGPADGNGSPVLGGGAVWVTSYSPAGGTLYELNPSNGAVRNQIAIAEGLPHFSSLSLGGSTAYLGTLDGVIAINGA